MHSTEGHVVTARSAAKLRTSKPALALVALVAALVASLLPAGAAHGQVTPPRPGLPIGVCEILVWTDTVTVLADTDDGTDVWEIMSALRVNPDELGGLPLNRPRETAATRELVVEGDAGDAITVEEQWRTEIYLSLFDRIWLHDLGIVVREDDGRAGDDLGARSIDLETPFRCGATVSFEVAVPVEPGARRGQRSDDRPGEILVEMTITTIDVRLPIIVF